MALTQEQLGQRLQDARKSVALTQQEAADQLGFARESLAQIEAGSRSVNSLEIVRLARLYGRSLSSILLEDEASEEQPLTAIFRMQDTLAESPGLREKLVEFSNIFQEARTIERLIGDEPRQLPPDYGIRDPRNNAEAYEQGQELAKQERQRLGLGNGPIPDMAEVISMQGVWAVSAEMPDHVSGICLFHSVIGAAVVINQNHSRTRRRFSYAHEYAHVLADRRNRNASISSSSNSKELIERRANSFASEFLMPSQGVIDLLGRIDKGGPSRETMWLFDPATELGEAIEKRNAPGSQEIGFHDVAFVADWFQVSYEAAAYRLSDLGKVTRDRLQVLLDQRDEGRRFIEHRGEEQPFLKAYVRWLAREAFRREAISGGRFRDFVALAGLNPEEEFEQVKEHFDD
ncbi:MAG: ImmA/IrrE family metallo-endopeptidase [Fimbriimonadaceae bacterium]|nr:ImmA/IrrE family metallo-endopeptidase [Fimbriimonadaceae bacterium]